MNRRNKATEMVTKNKTKVLSTPDHTLDSPSRDSDSMYDSETASPVPFLCTQDGTEGTTDVIWNYYSSNAKNSFPKNSTPISKKPRKSHRLKLPEKKLQPTQPKRSRVTQKKTQLPLELLELNQYVDKLMERQSKTNQIVEKLQSGSEEDLFSEAADHSPKSIFRRKKCLRKNVLSSRFSKPESETGLESDDSINECLLIASQAVEEKILSNVKPPSFEYNGNPVSNVNTVDDSIDALLQSVKSPHVNKLKHESPGLKNDSFDYLLGNLNDSALERLSQMPVKDRRRTDKDKSKQDTSWKVEELVHNDSPSSRISFTRYSSMPESPTVNHPNNSTTSNALSLGRYSSMPFNDSSGKETGDSPIRCSPLEIQRKRQQAREKLLAKRLLPFTQTKQSGVILPSQPHETMNNCKFELKVPTVSNPKNIKMIEKPESCSLKQNILPTDNSKANVDIRSLIEKKRQEALMKLKRKQLQK